MTLAVYSTFYSVLLFCTCCALTLFSSHFQPAGELSTLSCVAFECIQPIVTAWPLPNKYLGPAEVVSLVAVEQLG